MALFIDNDHDDDPVMAQARPSPSKPGPVPRCCQHCCPRLPKSASNFRYQYHLDALSHSLSASTLNFKAEMKTLKSFHIASTRMFRNSILDALLYTFQIWRQTICNLCTYTELQPSENMYCTHAIITCGLYIFTPFFTAVYNQE